MLLERACGTLQMAREEVIIMSSETLTKGERLTPEHVAAIVEPAWEERLRGLAIERIHRLRRFKLHLVTFALGVPILGGVWVLTEYFEEHTWPSRFASAPDVAGTWDPWFFFVAGIWALIVAVHAFRTYFGPPVGPIGRYIRRPVPRAELDREVERLRSSAWSGWYAG
jgi:2TM domain